MNMDTMEIMTVLAQSTAFVALSFVAVIGVKYFYKRSAMMRTMFFIDHSPRLNDLPVASGLPSLALFGIFVVFAQAWLAVPLMIVGVMLWNVRQELVRYDLNRVAGDRDDDVCLRTGNRSGPLLLDVEKADKVCFRR